MKPLSGAPVILLLLLSSLTVRQGLAKRASVSKITISSPELARPVEITDPEILNDFSPWQNLFFSSHRDLGDSPWSMAQPYEVFFWTRDGGERIIYMFYYYLSSAGGNGIIYLPGRGEPWYQVNRDTAGRADLDGSWLSASRSWDNVMQTVPLDSPTAGTENRAPAGQDLATSSEPAKSPGVNGAGTWLPWLVLFAVGFVSGGMAWSRIGRALAGESAN